MYFDSLVNACTVFSSFNDLLRHTVWKGYVPTLYGSTRRERILRRVLAAMGIQMYPAFTDKESRQYS